MRCTEPPPRAAVSMCRFYRALDSLPVLASGAVGELIVRHEKMSAALHIGDIGLWVTNGMRDEFLDWFAEHRCVKGDAQWEFSTSEGNRWPGCDIDLTCLFPEGKSRGLSLSQPEIDEAKRDHPWGLAGLLVLIDQILIGTWTHRLDAPEAYNWRKPNQSVEATADPPSS